MRPTIAKWSTFAESLNLLPTATLPATGAGIDCPGMDLSDFAQVNGAPGEIRTPGLLIRSQSLYPAELRAHLGSGLNLCQSNKNSRTVQSAASDRRSRFSHRKRWNQGQFLFNFEPRLANQLGHGGCVQSRRVVLHAERAGRTVKRKASDAVNLPRVRERKSHSLRRRSGIPKEDIYRGHIEG